MSELNAAERWLYTTLTGDATLAGVVGTKVYSDLASSEAVMPYVVFQYQGGADLMPVGPYRVWADMLYLVRGVAEGPSLEGSLKTIADRIDAVLHAASGSNAAGDVWVSVRERPFTITETVNGRTVKHLGGIYRLKAR